MSRLSWVDQLKQQEYRQGGKTPYGPNTDGWPIYDPYLKSDGQLVSWAKLSAPTVQFNDVKAQPNDFMLKAYDANARNAEKSMQQSLNEQSSMGFANLMSRGASPELLARTANNFSRSNEQALGDFYSKNAADRFGVQDQLAYRDLALSQWNAQNRLQNDQWNAQNQIGAQQFNIGNMIGENRYTTGSDMERYKTDKALQAAQAEAEAMRKRGSGGGFLSNLLGGIF